MHVIQGEMLQLSHAFLFFNKRSHCYKNIDKLFSKNFSKKQLKV